MIFIWSRKKSFPQFNKDNNMSCVLDIYLTLCKETLQSRYCYYYHFTGEETEV